MSFEVKVQIEGFSLHDISVFNGQRKVRGGSFVNSVLSDKSHNRSNGVWLLGS